MVEKVVSMVVFGLVDKAISGLALLLPRRFFAGIVLISDGVTVDKPMMTTSESITDMAKVTRAGLR